MTFWLAEEQIESLARSASDIQQLLRRELQAIDRKLKRLSPKSPDREDVLSEWVYVSGSLIQDVRYSLFLALYAQFEQALYQICDDFKLRLNVKLDLKDLGGAGLRRYQTFFRKIIGIEFPDNEPEWQRIVGLAELRNYLLHKTRWVSAQESDARIRNLVQQERYLAAPVSGPIEFKARFIPNVARLFNAFILEIAYRSLDDLNSFGSGLNGRLSLKRVKMQIRRGLRR